jgi:demethylmenaquinone methyltransferase/2-methoxy-6-polyprenyl-1,4-benzoquinol methylase
MTDDVLAGQLAYYRRRASEYDATAYGDLDAARLRIDRLVAALEPSGEVLEIACGTGMWTAALAAKADSVTALDAAPETVAIARDRVRATNVSFEVADVFAWPTTARFDTIFFSAWLSHVPTQRFDEFWRILRALLTDGGRVLFVDEPADIRDKENYIAGRDEIVERRLQDGSTHRIVKNFIEPDQLTQRLRSLGWTCRLRRDEHDWPWIYGEAGPS